jgi:NAD-dependent SIR2 family protein deacetylase
VLSVDTTTAFIVGAGVSPESWVPVQRALRRHLERIGLEGAHPVGDGLASFVFAHHIHWVRLWKREAQNHERTPEFRKLASGYEQIDSDLRRDIAAELGAAQESGEIKLQHRFLEALQLPWTGRKLVLTANWDTLLEPLVREPQSLLHLHGDIRNPATLLLPSEVGDDPGRGKVTPGHTHPGPTRETAPEPETA